MGQLGQNRGILCAEGAHGGLAAAVDSGRANGGNQADGEQLTGHLGRVLEWFLLRNQ